MSLEDFPGGGGGGWGWGKAENTANLSPASAGAWAELGKKTTSRLLAVLGDLRRYPMFIQSLAPCIYYKLSLFSRKSSNVLIGHALKYMIWKV